MIGGGQARMRPLRKGVVAGREGRREGREGIMPPTILTCSKQKDEANNGVSERRRRDS